MWLRICVYAFLLMTPNAALAEGGGCPAGYYPIGGQGAVGCAPMSDYGANLEDSSAETPQPRWFKTWGAIAIDGDLRKMGAAIGSVSKSEAKRAAVSDCRMRGGGRGCEKRVLAYENQCAVVVTADDMNKAVAAQSIEVASKLAMDACESALENNCHIYYSACSEPVFVN